MSEEQTIHRCPKCARDAVAYHAMSGYWLCYSLPPCSWSGDQPPNSPTIPDETMSILTPSQAKLLRDNRRKIIAAFTAVSDILDVVECMEHSTYATRCELCRINKKMAKLRERQCEIENVVDSALELGPHPEGV